MPKIKTFAQWWTNRGTRLNYHSRIPRRQRFKSRQSHDKLRIKVVLKLQVTCCCLAVSGSFSKQKCLILASSEWHGDNYRGGPHRNSLEASFCVRQCDNYVKIPVSYFYHICHRSGCQWIHTLVITSHSGKNRVDTDRRREGWFGSNQHPRGGLTMGGQIKSGRWGNLWWLRHP